MRMAPPAPGMPSGRRRPSRAHIPSGIASPVVPIAPPFLQLQFLAPGAAAVAMTERVQSPRPGRYGLSAVGQLFSRDTQAIFFNWRVGGVLTVPGSDSSV